MISVNKMDKHEIIEELMKNHNFSFRRADFALSNESLRFQLEFCRKHNIGSWNHYSELMKIKTHITRNNTNESFEFKVDFDFMLQIFTSHLNPDGKEPNDELCPVRDKIWEMMSNTMEPNEIRRMVLLEYACDDEVALYSDNPPVFYLFDHMSPKIWLMNGDEIEESLPDEEI